MAYPKRRSLVINCVLVIAAWFLSPVSSPASDRAELAFMDDDSLRAAVERSRYALRSASNDLESGNPGYFAVNHAQNLWANFNRNGIELAPKPGISADWRLTLRLSNYGYGAALQAVSSPEIAVGHNRIEYRYKPNGVKQDLTEWFINRPAGIEHGFVVSHPPARRSGDQPLHLLLQAAGDLTARMGDDGIEFGNDDGSMVLHYGELHVFDTAGRELASRLHLNGNQISLLVDDSTALYPIVVDPLIYSETKVTADDGTANDTFGFSVAMDGNTVVVGVPGDSYPSTCAVGNCLPAHGSAYVYERERDGFVETAFFTTDEYSYAFGFDVAIDGDRIVVGDPYGMPGQSGLIKIYARNGNSWFLEEYQSLSLQGENVFIPMPGARFSLDIEGLYIVVGMPYYKRYSTDDVIGIVRVFIRDGLGLHGPWNEQTTFHANDPDSDPEDGFGTSVAIRGDTVVVGAPNDDGDSGTVYVFTRVGNVWIELSRLVPNDPNVGSQFGAAVDISANSIIIGVPFDEILGGVDAGSAYIYVPGVYEWTEHARLLANDGGTNDAFGSAVSITDGGVAVVGAPLDNTAFGANAGSVYVFSPGKSTWTQQAQIFGSGIAADDRFGTAVAVEDTRSGHAILVGAPGENAAGAPDQGSAFFYRY